MYGINFNYLPFTFKIARHKLIENTERLCNKVIQHLGLRSQFTNKFVGKAVLQRRIITDIPMTSIFRNSFKKKDTEVNRK